MSTLHLINSTNQSKLERCLTHYQSGDAILLLNDGVYLMLKPEYNAAELTCYAIEADAKARGISLARHIEGADYDDFVRLSLTYDKSISWY